MFKMYKIFTVCLTAGNEFDPCRHSEYFIVISYKKNQIGQKKGPC